MQQQLAITDAIVGGLFAPNQFTPPSNSIPGTAISGQLPNSVLQHQYEKEYSQPGASNAAVERKVVHVVHSANGGTVVDFNVGARVAAIGGATATWDLYKNGASILTGTITLDNGTAAYVLKAGTLSATTLAQNDVLEVVVPAVAAGGGTLAQGLFATVTVRENTQ